jgi:cell division septation protein DedD
MREMGRSRGEQFWITRGQLAALGVTTASVAVLAFFVGLMVGRGPATDEPVLDEGRVGLIGVDVQADALTELLARVEEAAAATVPAASAAPFDEGNLDFPDELVAEELVLELPEPELPVIEDPVVVELEPLAEDDLPEAPEPPAEDVPDDGFAVQVFSFPTPDEANAKVVELQSRDYRAYRVDALVHGETWHRVRIGPYRSKEAAASAQAEINESLGTWDSRVTTVR